MISRRQFQKWRTADTFVVGAATRRAALHGLLPLWLAARKSQARGGREAAALVPFWRGVAVIGSNERAAGAAVMRRALAVAWPLVRRQLHSETLRPVA